MKRQFAFGFYARAAFHNLKQVIRESSTLALPNFTKPLIMEIDASSTSIGVILSQNYHPIAFFSKKLPLRMQKQFGYTRKSNAMTKSHSLPSFSIIC